MTDKSRAVTGEVVAPTTISAVWEAWTTEAGARTFLAPDCKIELNPGGAYEMYFMPESSPGLRGGEGCRVLAVQPEQMLSFTWNAPPSLPEVRGQFTHVVVRLFEELEGTRVKLNHDGWGDGGEWDQAFAYFETAWNKIVLPFLVHRFKYGPIDWANPPNFSGSEYL